MDAVMYAGVSELKGLMVATGSEALSDVDNFHCELFITQNDLSRHDAPPWGG